MSAANFGAEYATAPAFDVPYPQRACNCTTAAVDQVREQNECMREALAGSVAGCSTLRGGNPEESPDE